jgi:hypothetical protein
LRIAGQPFLQSWHADEHDAELPSVEDIPHLFQAGSLEAVRIYWNYLYITQKIAEEQDAARRQELLAAVQHGSVVSWRPINLHGEYDFSDERLQDSVGLRWPNDPAMGISHNGGHTELNVPHVAPDGIL